MIKHLWKLTIVFATVMMMAACGTTDEIENDMSPEEEPVNGEVNQEEQDSSEFEMDGSIEGEMDTEEPASSEVEGDGSLETDMNTEGTEDSELDVETETESDFSDN